MFNRDRQHHQRKHPGLGWEILMYSDEPGVYYSPDGRQVSQKMAEDAGYDVAAMRRQKQRTEKLKASQDEIAREFKDLEGGIAYEVGDYQVVKGSRDRFSIRTADGPVSAQPFSFEEAKRYADLLAKGDEEADDGNPKE